MSCSGGPHRGSSYWPFSETPDKVAGVKTAAERTEELHQVAAKAATATADEAARISANLATQLKAEEDPLLRLELLHTLAAYKTPIATQMLHSALEDGDADVRAAGCTAWGHRGGDEAVDVLARVLASDTDLDVRLAAARALGETKSQRAVAPLGESLSDVDPAMQNRIVESLKSITGREYENVDQWRQFARGGQVDVKTPSLAERVRKLF